MLGYVRIQNPNTYPSKIAGAPEPQMLTTFVINPIVTTTDESLRSFDPKRLDSSNLLMKFLRRNLSFNSRNCYFPDEKELRFFKAYSQENCLKECMSNATFEVCGCKEYFDIRN